MTTTEPSFATSSASTAAACTAWRTGSGSAPAARATASSSACTACRARAATSTRWRARCADGWRVVCPDVVGRGESDRLADPTGYALPTYVADMVTLLARLDAKTVHWFGTSMGGLIGMAPGGAAGLADRAPGAQRRRPGDRRRPALARIGAYLGQPLTWASEDEAADYLLTISQGFGPHSARANGWR